MLRVIILELLVLKVIVLLEIVVFKVFISTMNMINLDSKIFAKKTMIALIFKIDDDNIYIKIALIE